MPRKPGEKFGRKSSQGPDEYDIDAFVRECMMTFGRAPIFEIEPVEPGVFLVRCTLQAVVIGPMISDFVDARRCSVARDKVLMIMLQTAHRVYNEADRHLAAAIAEEDRTA
jgi:hypothetical protein